MRLLWLFLGAVCMAGCAKGPDTTSFVQDPPKSAPTTIARVELPAGLFDEVGLEPDARARLDRKPWQGRAKDLASQILERRFADDREAQEKGALALTLSRVGHTYQPDRSRYVFDLEVTVRPDAGDLSGAWLDAGLYEQAEHAARATIESQFPLTERSMFTLLLYGIEDALIVTLTGERPPPREPKAVPDSKRRGLLVWRTPELEIFDFDTADNLPSSLPGRLSRAIKGELRRQEPNLRAKAAGRATSEQEWLDLLFGPVDFELRGHLESYQSTPQAGELTGWFTLARAGTHDTRRQISVATPGGADPVHDAARQIVSKAIVKLPHDILASVD